MEQEYEHPENCVADYEDALLIGKSQDWLDGFYEGKLIGFREARKIVNAHLA